MNIKKILAGSVIGTIALAASIIPAFAGSDHSRFNDPHKTNRQLNPKTCQTVGRAVIDVTQKVKNDVDSGQSGNYWAFDYNTRHIQVWQNNDNDPTTWCAIVSYDGDFYAIPGQVGPGDSSPTGTRIDSPVQGDYNGGYRAIITGTLLTPTLWTKHGNVGTTNYHCNITADCPGYVDWIAQYFGPTYGFDYQYWGWTYKAGNHQTWVNKCGTDIPTNPACTGNSGNIL